MKWDSVLSQVQDMVNVQGEPSMLIIHCGANDLIEVGSLNLREHICMELRYLAEVLPHTLIVWSQMLPRQRWRGTENASAANRARIRVNRGVAHQVLDLGGGYIKYPDIQSVRSELFDEDEVHLSDLGNNILLNCIQGAIERMLFWGDRIFPLQ